MQRRWILGACLTGASVALLCGACTKSNSEEAIQFRVPVSVKEVKVGTVEDRIVATGSLRTSESLSLTVETGGILHIETNPRSGRRLAEGDSVSAGQHIATISGEEIRLAARSEATRRRYETARRDFESKKRLFEEGLIPEQELSQAEASLAESQVEVERSQFTESRTGLESPIAGVLLRLARDTRDRPLADGQRVTAGFSVAEIAPLSPLIADIDLVGPDASRVRVDQEVRLRHHGWKGKTFHGRVLRIAPSLDPVTRAFRVEIEIKNKEGQLKPGMFVEATIIVERHIEVPIIPRRALTERSGKKVVFVLKGQRVSQRELHLGLGDDEIVEVRGGLEVGEKIVTKGLETLADNSQVRVTGS